MDPMKPISRLFGENAISQMHSEQTETFSHFNLVHYCDGGNTYTATCVRVRLKFQPMQACWKLA